MKKISNNFLYANLREHLKDLNIKVFVVSRNELSDCKVFCAGAIPSQNIIILIQEDIEKCILNKDEIMCILWHEYAHLYYHTSDEQKCDSLSIRYMGRKVYESACEKTHNISGGNSEKYSHRSY